MTQPPSQERVFGDVCAAARGVKIRRMHYNQFIQGVSGPALLARARRVPQRIRRLAFSVRTLSGRPVAADIGGGAHALLTARGAMAEAAWTRDAWLQRWVCFFIRVVQPNMVMVDVGAGSGLFALAVSLRVRPCDVIAIESDPALVTLLEANLALNAAGHLVQVNTPPHDAGTGGDVGVTLSEMLRARSLKHADVIRLDASGAERLFLERSRDLLEGTHAPLLAYDADAQRTARWGYHPVEITWLLRDCGYTLFTLDAADGDARRPAAGKFDGPRIAVKPSHPSYQYMEPRTP